ncbi:MAG: VCBS repeat-containing protein [Planctomycetes bacterium]|nr:VCBS repeat-containing protein [Planctomycetota bacterium]
MSKFLTPTTGAVAAFLCGPALAQFTLTESTSYTIGGTQGPPDAADVAVLDVDGDGLEDLVAYNSDGIFAPPFDADFLAILFGTGGGAFAPPVQTSQIGFTTVGSPEFLSRLKPGEFTGDGRADLVLTHHGTQQVALIPNDGLGGFATPLLFDTGALVSSLAVGDFDEDGLDDVLALSLSGYTLHFLAGTGTGLAAPVSMPSGLVSTWQPWDFAVADVDADGHLDAVVPYQSNEFGVEVNQVVLFKGNGDGTFAMGSPSFVDVGPILSGSRTYVQVADLDSDNRQDVVAVRDVFTSGSQDHVHVTYGNATGWDTPQAYVVSGEENLSECVIADMNFDGHLDIVTVCNGPFVYEVLLGDGNRGFTGQGQGSVGSAAGMYSVGAADVTGDNKLDVVLGFHFTGEVKVLRNDTPGNPLPGTAYCFGVGSACPCANENDGSNGPAGCANGFSAGGASLTGLGTASVSADSVVLTVTGAQPGQPGLFFRADNAVGAGLGAIFGDGLRCAGGNVVRLGTVISNGSGTATSTSSVGSGLSGGETKRYQYWYRNPAGSPCGAAFNLSNGYEITWGA